MVGWLSCPGLGEADAAALMLESCAEEFPLRCATMEARQEDDPESRPSQFKYIYILLEKRTGFTEKTSDREGMYACQLHNAVNFTTVAMVVFLDRAHKASRPGRC